MMQPHRIGLATDRATAYARRVGLDESLVVGLYTSIIDYACRVEDDAMIELDRNERSPGKRADGDPTDR